MDTCTLFPNVVVELLFPTQWILLSSYNTFLWRSSTWRPYRVYLDIIILNSRWQCLTSNPTHILNACHFSFCKVWIRELVCICENKKTTGDLSPPPLTRWCISWTAAWSRSSPSLCRWSQHGVRWEFWRPLGLLSAAAWPCGNRPPRCSPLLPQPVWCSAETAPITTHMPHKCSFYNSERHEIQQQQLKQTHNSST